jgi:hypothetical protein
MSWTRSVDRNVGARAGPAFCTSKGFELASLSTSLGVATLLAWAEGKERPRRNDAGAARVERLPTVERVGFDPAFEEAGPSLSNVSMCRR